MRTTESIGRIGRAVFISTLVAAVNLRAQNLILERGLVEKPPVQSFADSARRPSERVAESDWIRGYRDGHQLGFSNGIQDVRAMLPPVVRPPGYGTRLFNTPYRQGYVAGYTDGYLRAYSYPWPLHFR